MALPPAPPAAPPPGGSNPAAPLLHNTAVMKFLVQFLKDNPDIAREMSTRMTAALNNQKLQGLRAPPPGMAPAPGAPPPGLPGRAAPPAMPAPAMAGGMPPVRQG